MRNKLFIVLILGCILRITYLWYAVAPVTSDVSQWGLMVRHISNGSDFPLFRYGTESLGSLTAYMAAIFCKITSNDLMALYAVEIILSLLFVVIAYFAGKNLLNKQFGIVSATLVSLGPSILIKSAIFPVGIYNLMFLLGNLLFLLSLKLTRQDYAKIGTYAFFGVICGIMFWTHVLSLCFIVSCILFIMLSKKSKLDISSVKNAAVAIVFFVAGSFPFWLANFNNDFSSFKEIIFYPLVDIVSCSSRDMVFLQLFNLLEIESILSIAGIIGIIYFVSFAYILFKYRDQLIRQNIGLPFIFVTVSMVVITRVKVIPHLDIHPVVILYAGFPYLTAFVLFVLKNKSKRLFKILFVAVLGVQVLSCSLHAVNDKVKNELNNKGLHKLATELETRDIQYVYTNGKLDPIIRFLTNEKVKTTLGCISEDDVLAHPAIVLPIEESVIFEQNLKYICFNYSKINCFNNILFCSFLRPEGSRIDIIPSNWDSTANYNCKDSKLAFDRDIHTRWTSGFRQLPGMCFMLDIGRETLVDKIILCYGKYSKDNPLSLEISGSDDGKNWIQLVYVPCNSNKLFWSNQSLIWNNNCDRQEYYFKAAKIRYLKFNQFGYKDSNENYWSIAEIFIYSPLQKNHTPDFDTEGLDLYLKDKGLINVYTDFMSEETLKLVRGSYCGDMKLSTASAVVVGDYLDLTDDMEYFHIKSRKDFFKSFIIYSFVDIIGYSVLNKNDYMCSSNVRNAGVEKAHDCIMETRWTSDKLQEPGFDFRVEFKNIKPVCGVRLWHKGSENDFPVKMRIEYLDRDGAWTQLAYKEDFTNSLYWNGYSITIDSSKCRTYIFDKVDTKSIRCILDEKSNYYWSIHELELLSK